MTVLVTGCAGFIGSHLTEALLAQGHRVTGLDCFNDNYDQELKRANLSRAADWEGFRFAAVNLVDDDLAPHLEGARAVFHLAGEPGVRTSWGGSYRRYLDNNILATQRLLEALKESPNTRVVYASSSSVYGEATMFPTPEQAPTAPISPYGQTKLSAEHLCHVYRANYGLDAVSLRYFTVFGPRQRPDMAFHIFCKAVLEGRPLTVFGDGSQTRDFTYVGDIVAGTIAASTAPLDGERTFNLGGGSPDSLRNALALIGEISGRELEIEYRDTERGDVRDTLADTTRARELLGFAPATSLAEGLAAEFAWISSLRDKR